MCPTITKRKMRGITYYYLEHSIRENSRVSKKSRYLGRTIPKDIEKIKKQFVYELNSEKWFKFFDEIKRNYVAELAKIPKSAKQKDLNDFSVRFTYNTQRIEGSTLSLRETALLLEKGISPSEKPIADIREAEAHQKVFFEMVRHRKDLSLGLVLYWHKKLFEGTKLDIAGQIRKRGVRISGSSFVPPSPVELQSMLRQFFSWYNREKERIHPVELASLVHLKFVTIHPFTDGNGRISRLMMNFVLKRHEYPMLNIEYNNRRAYYNALERSQISKDEAIFPRWLFRKYFLETKNYLRHNL